MLISRLHNSTTQMWPVGTDGVAWSVGRSVSLSVCHCKNGLSVRDAVWDIMTEVGARNHVLDCGSDVSHEGAILRGEKLQPIVKYGTLCSELCKNGCTD